MSCCNMYVIVKTKRDSSGSVTIPQAVWAVATIVVFKNDHYSKMLQYRKRYELLQQYRNIKFSTKAPVVTIPQAVWAVATKSTYLAKTNSSYNTASGMSCCNFIRIAGEKPVIVTIPQAVWAVATWMASVHLQFSEVTIPQAVWAVATKLSISMAENSDPALQYRKRYELLQREIVLANQPYRPLQYRKRYELLQHCYFSYWVLGLWCYNTASGMSCCNIAHDNPSVKALQTLQYRKRYELLQRDELRDVGSHVYRLQYRKRYELLQQLKTLYLYVSYGCYNTASGMSCCNSVVRFCDLF